MSARRQKAHETLIDIVGVSKKLHTALARKSVNLQGVTAQTRLNKIIVASHSILAKSLGNDSVLDPRLEDWLCSKEPDMCLLILNDMEKLITTELGVLRETYSKWIERNLIVSREVLTKRRYVLKSILRSSVEGSEVQRS